MSLTRRSFIKQTAAATAASARDWRPGNASASPMRNPAAPEIMIANNSVVPWIISQPMNP